ncbi:MAG: hypothetical protein IJ599_04055, partial [Alphaproteobacteria bacterium]|nr:hypothetical protein [Alphaproteobacteria bacterium]
ETPNKMPEMPKSVIAVQDEAVLVAKASGATADDNDVSATTSDAGYSDIPEEDNDTEKRTTPVQKKIKAREKSTTARMQKKEEAEAKEVARILNSNEKIEMKDDEALIEVSEEPIG